MAQFRKAFFGATVGSMIEYYDYALSLVFITITTITFFPAATPYDSLVRSYYFLLITIFARPLGGLLFGYLGDRFGRRVALLTSMYGIALGTLIIGLTPGALTIGCSATIILVACKFLQLLCYGGEFNGAGIYVVEHAEDKNKILYSSLVNAFTVFGSFVASIMGIILTMSGMPAWSWRIAFIIGSSIGIFGIYYRKNLTESPCFKPTNYSIKSFFSNNPKQIFVGILVGGLSSVQPISILAFIDPVLVTLHIFTQHAMMWLQSLWFFCALLTYCIAGKLLNNFSAHSILKNAAILILLSTYPLMYLIDHGNHLLIIFALLSMLIINQIFVVPVHVFYRNIFPMHYRYRGASFSYCFGMALFAGITPIVNHWLFHKHQLFSQVAIWPILVSFLTLCGLRFLKPLSNKILEHA